MRPKSVRLAIENALDSPESVQPLFLWEAQESANRRYRGKSAGKEKSIWWTSGCHYSIQLTCGAFPPSWMKLVLDAKAVEGENRDCPVCGGTGLRTVAKWLEPAMLPTDGRGILFFDELTSAPPLQQATAYQVTLDRRIGEYVVPDGYFIMAAGNNQTDRAVVLSHVDSPAEPVYPHQLRV